MPLLNSTYEIALYTGVLLGLWFLLRWIASSLHSLIGFFGEARLTVDTHLNNVRFPVSYWTEKGKRPYQEDRYHAMHAATHESSLYGVFDGHGGKRAAEFCKTHILPRISQDATFSQDPKGALVRSFLEVDREFSQEARDQGWNDGTTSVVAVVTQREVFVANAGDSRAILLRRCLSPSSTSSSSSLVVEAVPLSLDHRPDRRDEETRIRALGGRLLHWGRWRVEGVLAVSRAIGDVSLQPFITAEPEITRRPRDLSRDLCIVLASDGLFDVMENRDVASFLAPHLQREETKRRQSARQKQLRRIELLDERQSFSLPPGTSISPLELSEDQTDDNNNRRDSSSGSNTDNREEGEGESAEFKDWAQLLVKEALRRGSADNITAVVVDLRPNESEEEAEVAVGERDKGAMENDDSDFDDDKTD